MVGIELARFGEPPFEALGRISRAAGAFSTPDCLRFGGGPVIRCSKASGADLRLLDVLALAMVDIPE